MAQLKTTFAGLTLNNPIIVSSSGLTDSPEKIKKLEEAGAGAVVLKSVFEEQITLQAGAMHGYGTPEADDYLNAYIRSHTLNEHISLIEETKKACAIPVIASINCYSDNEWADFAKLMEKAGADALEINILSLQTEKDYIPGSFEQRHINILRHVKKEVNIPVIMKLGSNFTNPVALIEQSVITTQENTSSIKYRESIYCSLLQTVLYTTIIVYLPNLTFVNGTQHNAVTCLCVNTHSNTIEQNVRSSKIHIFYLNRRHINSIGPSFTYQYISKSHSRNNPSVI